MPKCLNVHVRNGLNHMDVSTHNNVLTWQAGGCSIVQTVARVTHQTSARDLRAVTLTAVVSTLCVCMCVCVWGGIVYGKYGTYIHVH